jgi:DNA-binding transcriptional LysR family regulator
MDRFDAMVAFVAVAELRGFAPAARQLKISPSSVTRLIAALEGRLGVELLRRTTRSVTLTDAGARYLRAARAIVDDVREAEDSAKAQSTAPSGRLVITAPNLFGRREVAPLVSDYLARYPGVTGELILTDRLVNLVEEGIDVAVRIAPTHDASLRMRKVGATRRVVVASPSYLSARKRLRVPKDVRGHAIIQMSPLTPAHEWHFFHDNRRERIPIRPTFVTNSADAGIMHAQRGHGLAVVFSYQVRDLVRAGELKIVLANFEPRPVPIYIVYPATRQPSANVRAFIDMAVATRQWSFVEV